MERGGKKEKEQDESDAAGLREWMDGPAPVRGCAASQPRAPFLTHFPRRSEGGRERARREEGGRERGGSLTRETVAATAGGEPRPALRIPLSGAQPAPPPQPLASPSRDRGCPGWPGKRLRWQPGRARLRELDHGWEGEGALQEGGGTCEGMRAEVGRPEGEGLKRGGGRGREERGWERKRGLEKEGEYEPGIGSRGRPESGDKAGAGERG